MPALDQCEPQIIRALEKKGWVLEAQPRTLLAPDVNLYADLGMRSPDNKRGIVIEVKCFPPGRSKLDELYRAVGQYLMYETVLELMGVSQPVFIAVPNRIYADLLQRESVQKMLARAKIKMIVVSIEMETVEQWINW